MPRGGTGSGGGGSAYRPRAQRGVSALWPLLALEGAGSRAASLPAEIAESLLATDELQDADTLRALRLVCRATRAVVDARVKSVGVGFDKDGERRTYIPSAAVERADVSAKVARFPALESVRVFLNYAQPATVASLADAMPRLQQLREIKVIVRYLDSYVQDRLAALGRALPPRLEALEVRAFFSSVYGDGLWLVVEAWVSLRHLSIDCFDQRSVEPLAAATALTALRSLRVGGCRAARVKEPAYWGPPPPLPPFPEDSGLRLLAKAPWIQQLMELKLFAST